MLVPVLVLVQVLILYYLLVGLKETEAQSVTAHPSLCYLLFYQAACLPLHWVGVPGTLLRGGRTQYTIGVLSPCLLKREGSGMVVVIPSFLCTQTPLGYYWELVMGVCGSSFPLRTSMHQAERRWLSPEWGLDPVWLLVSAESMEGLERGLLREI